MTNVVYFVKRQGVWLVVALLVMVGCSSAPAAGTVVERRKGLASKVVVYKVCVRDATGHEGCERVHHDVYARCLVGSRWPDCRDQRGNK